MKVLFLSNNPLVTTLGTPKVLIELAEAMSHIGWEPTLLQPSDFGLSSITCLAEHELFSQRFGDYVEKNGDQFDAIDYEHLYLPFPRGRFSPHPLLVARSALLVYHLESKRIPVAPGIKAALGRARRFLRHRREIQSHFGRADVTFREADLINLNNSYDKDLLVRRGFAADKIAVVPLGITDARRTLFQAVSADPPPIPTVGFVGTFDYRKGALDFPKIVAALIAAVPGVRFKLLGTVGLFKTADAVKAFFPKEQWPHIEVIPRFDPDQLPKLLADVSVGMFPSYSEGFGLGVLEMLAAAVPVIAYDVPGPPMMLPPDWLVPAGDHSAMAKKLVRRLQSPRDLARARTDARSYSTRFEWSIVARQTADLYSAAIERRTTAAAQFASERQR